MGTPRHEKINQLVKDWSRGTVRIASYLNNLGYQKDLLKKYVNSGWLDSLGYGAYKLKEDYGNRIVGFGLFVLYKRIKFGEAP
jgi:Transcriptional regulator, AbiEi antitoxin N-terminal domain